MKIVFNVCYIFFILVILFWEGSLVGVEDYLIGELVFLYGRRWRSRVFFVVILLFRCSGLFVFRDGG